MMRALFSLVLVLVLVVVTGCQPPAGPTAEEGAAYLGLVSGTTFNYAISDGLTESHEVKDSGVLFDGESVDVLAKQNGFANDERTLTLGVDVESVSILRFLDCVARCGALSAPIPFLQWPLEEGQSVQGEAEVTVTANGASVIHTERHSTTVGASESITVPAGSFDAFLINWTTTTINADASESSEVNVLHWSPDVGIVKWDAPDGSVLELSTEP